MGQEQARSMNCGRPARAPAWSSRTWKRSWQYHEIEPPEPPMLRRNFEQVWNQLRAKRAQFSDYLERIVLDGIRGFKDLRVPFQYPVTVLAGPNACGKSTVLFAAACAYRRVKGDSLSGRYPSEVFPDVRDYDIRGAVRMEFHYIVSGSNQAMTWSRSRDKWNRSYFGRKKGSQPARKTYLRTLANLTSPSEVRRFLQFSRGPLQEQTLPAEVVAFAHRILNREYDQVTVLKGVPADRDMLHARLKEPEPASYSEFHMSAGERAILRLAKDVSGLEGALVLIDEIEAGLHPFTQQHLMLELQRMALRNEIQFIIATHSPAVLETVPAEARVFLERQDGAVNVRPPFRDIMQRALYGRPLDKLLVLCEDEVAEALIRGVLDVLGPALDWLQSNVEVGRDSGMTEFPAHVRTLAMLRQLDSTLFILDGDARELIGELQKAAGDQSHALQTLFLPGEVSPEQWIWDRLRSAPSEYEESLGLSSGRLRESVERIGGIYASAVDKPRNIAKNRLVSLSDELQIDMLTLARTVGRREGKPGGELRPFANALQDKLSDWRSRA
jgi:predicted ATPase